MSQHMHTVEDYVCHIDESGVERWESARTPDRRKFIEDRLDKRKIEHWPRKKYISR